MTRDANRGPTTFLGAPFAHDYTGARAAFLGLPFDCGTAPNRIGSRHGPEAIRRASTLLASNDPECEANLIETLCLVDGGDAPVTASRIEPSFAAIEAAVGAIHIAGAVPVTVGGDGVVTLPQLRAARASHGPLAVLHFDAHTDTYPYEGYNTATTFTRAAEEDLVLPGESWHVGLRGMTGGRNVWNHTRQLGYRTLTMDEVADFGIAATAAQLHRAVAGRPVYLCWDMDVFDPAAAPGVCDPVWGGLSAREGLAMVRGLAGLDIVAIDINTTSPPHDVAGMTALLAATVAQSGLRLIAQKVTSA